MNFEFKEKYNIQDLIQIVRILRDPVNGCPWDRVQSHESIRMNFLEETCEVLEAVDLNDQVLMCEELGDVLLQVIMHSLISEQEGCFNFDDVCNGICLKLITRHPNIFNEQGKQENQMVEQETWDSIKNREKGRLSVKDELESVPRTLPALMKAAKIQKRAAAYGIGQCSIEKSLSKMKYTIDQLTLCGNSEKKIGELLFSAVQLATLFNINPELALEKECQYNKKNIIYRNGYDLNFK